MESFSGRVLGPDVSGPFRKGEGGQSDDHLGALLPIKLPVYMELTGEERQFMPHAPE